MRTETVVALSGMVGVAFGFALKDLATSVLAGLTILIDKPFQVGDRISMGKIYGEVVAIGLRSVRVLTLDDSLVTIPNGLFLNDIVSSGNAGGLTMMVQIDFFIGGEQDARRGRELVAESLTSSRFFSVEHPWTVLVNQTIHNEYFATRLRAKAYVIDVRHENAFETDVTLRVMEAFREAGIAPPAQLIRAHQTGEPRAVSTV